MTEATTTSVGARGDRITLLVLSAVAAVLGLVSLVVGGSRTVRIAFAAGETPLDLLTRAEVPHSSDSVPVLVSAGFTQADLVASGLSDGTRVLLAVGQGLGVLTGAVVCFAIAYLFFSLSRGRPFARPLYVLTIAAGATLTFGTMLSQFIAGFGRMNAATELNPGASDVFVVGFEFDPTLWLVGFAVMALAFVFRAGARLQRDTAGLV